MATTAVAGECSPLGAFARRSSASFTVPDLTLASGFSFIALILCCNVQVRLRVIGEQRAHCAIEGLPEDV